MDTRTQHDAAGDAASKGIDVDALERELSSMWTETTRQKEGDARAGMMRACVLNLILYSTRRDERAKVDALLDEVTERHPSRALVLFADRSANAAARLDAHVSMRCQIVARGVKQICGEQVTIEASGAVVERIASAVAPLLVPDVPVFLWWDDIPGEDDKLFARMSEMADRVVVDSACSADPHADLVRLARMIAARGALLRASDINWGRLTSWRGAVAHFWDVPSYRPHLDAIERVRIEYDPPERAPTDVSAQSLLVAGWLASRLGWRIEASEADTAEGFKTTRLRAGDGRVIKIEWRAVDVAGCERMISSVAFASAATGAEFHVRWKHERTQLETCVRLGDEQIVNHVVSYQGRTDGKRLSAELDLLARDSIYEQALDAAARLVETFRTSRT